ncbi:hypothetical protein Egran_05919 [Elaphomyces granulatus]|uniref:RlpA-like protein double-psi beta-barrel domain-containing protein n=1 Tax=Elaphomyces granulatus TaxID=519963 RepID=A0A232LQE2_9EURO|nr:hypothetical protein Egran_05919 [Elaphomyces granulatus]
MMLPQVMVALTAVLGLISAAPTAVYTGRGTVYFQQNATGSCGQRNPDSAIIAAIGDAWMMDESPSPIYCGRKIKVKNIGSDSGTRGTGNELIVTVADTCASCSKDDVDFSVSAWNHLTNQSAAATFKAQWSFYYENGAGNSPSHNSSSHNSSSHKSSSHNSSSPDSSSHCELKQ